MSLNAGPFCADPRLKQWRLLEQRKQARDARQATARGRCSRRVEREGRLGVRADYSEASAVFGFGRLQSGSIVFQLAIPPRSLHSHSSPELAAGNCS